MLPRISSKPSASTSAALRVRTAPRVASGMNAGVSTVPCAVRSRPARAAAVARVDLEAEPRRVWRTLASLVL